MNSSRVFSRNVRTLGIRSGNSVMTMLFLLVTIVNLLTTGCRDDEFSGAPGEPLIFSQDTVLFDTVFSSIGTATQSFKVINPNPRSVNIRSIATGQGESSPYRINVDGTPGRVNDYELRGEDSFYVFVDVKIDPADENLPFIVRDSVVFQTDNRIQDVKLVAWGQDANFFRRTTICDETWTADKPYVLSDTVWVRPGCVLQIEPGTKIHSDRRSSLLVSGTMNVSGSAEKPVVFQGVRPEDFYEHLDGQWAGIRFLAGSGGNSMEHTRVRNAIIGVQSDSMPPEPGVPNLTLSNTIIQNMSLIGLQGFTSHIEAQNLLINNVGLYAFRGELGGEYTFLHSTFGSFSFDFRRDQPSVVLGNTNYENIANDLEVTFLNSIIWGSLEDELAILDQGDGTIDVGIGYSLIRTTLENLPDHVIVNEDPLFKDPREFDYTLEEGSPAIGAGTGLGIGTDLRGKPRDSENPDLGAFERQ